MIKAEKIAPPAEILICAPDPAPPPALASVPQSADADYMLVLWAAWSDCSDKLARVRAFVSP
ncbi:hypothetical protein [Paramagnetospirillum magneticum]|uniref:hypothetical protein n=1 Tax=Paramagnetospirillum magneticum TaxID=84159 RepID=UPI0005C2184B|nr:hypothetical protein [Paramagnetospirillum magneticum]